MIDTKPRNKVILFCFSVFLLWVTIIYIFVTAQFKYTPLNISKTLTLEEMLLVPQGWGFFTRNPREDKIRVFRKDKDRYIEILDKNFSIQNIFGISRKNRITLNEILFNLKAVDDSSWYDAQLYTDSLLIQIPTIPIKNQAENPLCCGDLLILKEKTLPWAWRKHEKSLNSIRGLIKITLICE